MYAMWSMLRNDSVPHATKMRWCGEAYDSDSNRSGSLHDILPSRMKINQESRSKLASPKYLAAGRPEVMGTRLTALSEVSAAAHQSVWAPRIKINPQEMISIRRHGGVICGVKVKIRARHV